MNKKLFKTLTISAVVILGLGVSTPSKSFATENVLRDNKRYNEVFTRIISELFSSKSISALSPKLNGKDSGYPSIESSLVNRLAKQGYKLAKTEKEFEKDDVFGDKLLLTYLVTTMDGSNPDVGELFDTNMRLIAEYNLFDTHNIVLTVLPA